MLRLMTFNIRYGLADDGVNRWDNRKHPVIERIQAFDPDLLGMQECRDDFQAEFIQSNLPEYEFYGVRRANDGETALEMAPILFKRSDFQLMRKGCFWLSEMPQVVGSKSWGSTFPRTVSWVDLMHHTSGRSLTFLNTHFDYAPAAISESVRVLKTWIDQHATDRPLLVTGDFNADKESTAYHQLTQGGNLQDIYRAGASNTTNEGTFHGYGQTNTSIDWMLASRHFEVIHAEIDRYHDDNLYPSDHYPVFANLEWQG